MTPEQRRAYRAANLEKVRAQERARAEKRALAGYDKKEYQRAWYQANKKKLQTYRKVLHGAWYQANREKVIAKVRAYRQANKDKEAAYWRYKNSGFTPELTATAMCIQEGRCGVCARSFEVAGRVHADHCHDTKTPRGLLCALCNMAEGMIKKTGVSPEEFGRRLAAYLANPPAKIAELV